jgi:beta-glucanase (GH16 family)
VPSATPSAAAGPTSDPATWPLAWSDEFDGAAGSPPDSASWGYDIGGEGWGNNERQYYTDEIANASLDGKGHLRITARESDGSLDCHYGPCEYTSARLLTKGRIEVQYGRIEARIKVPAGFGLWPAFWMLGNDIDTVSWPASGEIDIMEFVGRRPNEILGTLHGPGYSGGSGITASVDLGVPVSDEFHTYAVEWQPGLVRWYFDGTPYHEVRPSDVAPNAWVFDHPFFMLLNVAVGGNLGGPVFPDTIFPRSMVVDYVRLYQETTP